MDDLGLSLEKLQGGQEKDHIVEFWDKHSYSW
jgi:hypothetical protein